jgi:hypothetical protein
MRAVVTLAFGRAGSLSARHSLAAILWSRPAYSTPQPPGCVALASLDASILKA